jgi:glucose-6-phosphate dehydrogenase assembly protein OpcA
VADLAWTRLTKIRELLSQLLGDRGANPIRNVAIDYAGAEPLAGVKYMQAWLRSELPGVDVDLHRVDLAGRGEIKAIRVDPDLNIQVRSNCAEFETGTMRQRANLPGCADPDLLREELSIMTHDRVFERALQRMSVWIPRS